MEKRNTFVSYYTKTDYLKMVFLLYLIFSLLCSHSLGSVVTDSFPTDRNCSFLQQAFIMKECVMSEKIKLQRKLLNIRFDVEQGEALSSNCKRGSCIHLWVFELGLFNPASYFYFFGCLSFSPAPSQNRQILVCVGSLWSWHMKTWKIERDGHIK